MRLAFPLLRELTNLGAPIATHVFKDEIARRYASGHPKVRTFPEKEGFLNYFSREELSSLKDE